MSEKITTKKPVTSERAVIEKGISDYVEANTEAEQDEKIKSLELLRSKFNEVLAETTGRYVGFEIRDCFDGESQIIDTYLESIEPATEEQIQTHILDAVRRRIEGENGISVSALKLVDLDARRMSRLIRDTDLISSESNYGYSEQSHEDDVYLGVEKIGVMDNSDEATVRAFFKACAGSIDLKIRSLPTLREHYPELVKKIIQELNSERQHRDGIKNGRDWSNYFSDDVHFNKPADYEDFEKWWDLTNRAQWLYLSLLNEGLINPEDLVEANLISKDQADTYNQHIDHIINGAHPFLDMDIRKIGA